MKDISSLTVQGTTECANKEDDRPGSKLALLIPNDSPLVFGMARAFQTFSEDHREAVQIFTDFNEAVTWLADDENEVKQ